jgi:pilus assembly protein CpaB
MQSNKRALWSLLIGLVLAVVAVVGVSRMLGEQPEAQAPFKVVSVVVAAHDLSFGTELDKAVLTVKDWPENSLPQGSFAKIEDVLGDGTEPRVALKPIVTGEPVLASKVTGFGAKATMSTALPEGKRAFSVRVNDISGVGGFLLPGDRVDVLLTRQIDEKERDKLDQVTDVILQNVVVRGIDQIADEDRNKPQVVKAVTLEVTPEDAQKLALAQQVGELSLALRNVATNDTAKTRSVRVRDLVNEPAPAPAPAPKQFAEKPKRLEPAPPSVIVRHGSKSENVVFTR